MLDKIFVYLYNPRKLMLIMFGFDLTEYDKIVYEEEIDGFLPKNIIDAHTHVYTVASKRQKTGPVYWPSRVAEDNSVEDITKTYEDLFPNQKVVPVIFGNPGGYLDIANAYCSEKSKEYGYPALFLPHFNDSAEFVEEQVANYKCSLGKLMGHQSLHL